MCPNSPLASWHDKFLPDDVHCNPWPLTDPDCDSNQLFGLPPQPRSAQATEALNPVPHPSHRFYDYLLHHLYANFGFRIESEHFRDECLSNFRVHQHFICNGFTVPVHLLNLSCKEGHQRKFQL